MSRPAFQGGGGKRRRYPPRGWASVSYNAPRGFSDFLFYTSLVGNRLGTAKTLVGYRPGRRTSSVAWRLGASRQRGTDGEVGRSPHTPLPNGTKRRDPPTSAGPDFARTGCRLSKIKGQCIRLLMGTGVHHRRNAERLSDLPEQL